MEKEREILGLLKVMSEQILQMDGRLTRIEQDVATIKQDMTAAKQDIAAIKGVTQLIPNLVSTVDDLHNKEIGRSGLFAART
jgi:hypothetical protein